MIFDASTLIGKDIVFVGLGKGRAAAGLQAFLERHAGIASFTGVDKQVDISVGQAPLGFLCDYDSTETIFIKNEGIPGPELPVPYITPLQIFFEIAHASSLTTVGVTGTKGKSTTTSLAAHMLQTAGLPAVLAGNIGTSPWELLEAATAETIFVLELSSYQLSDLHRSPHISACINLYNDHVDWHGSLEAYWEAKHNIMRFAVADDVFIYNPDFEALRGWAAAANCQTIHIDPTEQLDMSSAKLFGDHNRLNALVARQIARQFGVNDTTAQAALNSFEPLRHRMQVVTTKQSITYVDDAIGMTPESTTASLAAITKKVGPVGCLLLGGQDRGYDFSGLMQAVASANIPHLVLFPETEAKMLAALPYGYTPEFLQTKSMVEAVAYAAVHAPANSVVLLSTAAPSYLLWKDFEDKGDQFQVAVTAL